jgi:hypothetical protein
MQCIEQERKWLQSGASTLLQKPNSHRGKEFSAWEQDFMTRNKTLLIDLIKATNFLKITNLLASCCQSAVVLIELK